MTSVMLATHPDTFAGGSIKAGAVDPGTAANQCGTAGAYFVDTVCAAYYDVQFFGLDGGSTPPPTTSTTSFPGYWERC